MNTSNGVFEIMDNNDSSPAAKPVYKPLASTIMYSVAFILGTTGNGLVIYVTGCKMKKTVNTVWFHNLAVADFIFTAFLLFTIVSSSRHYDWPFGDFLCKLNTLVVVLNMFASIFILTAISVDRCLCTWVVVWAKNKRTPRKAEIICIIIWLAALGCSLPYAIPRAAISEGNAFAPPPVLPTCPAATPTT
ncbi:hypothetical protein MATL_G00126290 [Megalops atlanticus]|uniref:G-protein coupled receptors family 1 profile domain-containing protein n=1 Tax=Megalops atlanticus TaxID=7932 RepID=A0A9D3TA22_MEGAT|nr:hypothetical protein MATL_G00126290 [Megalops atlanticus]